MQTQSRDRRPLTRLLIVLVGAAAAACSVAEPASPLPTVRATGNPAQSRSPSATPLTATPTPEPEPAGRTPTWDPFGPPIDPVLFDILPAEISGYRFERLVAPASAFQTGGDVCSFICPNEPQVHADAFGVEPDDLMVGFAYPPQPYEEGEPKVYVIAWRPLTRPERSLLEGRLSLMKGPGGGPSIVQRLTIAGKSVTRVYHTFFTADYLYEYDDLLFVIYGEDHRTPDDLAAWTEHEPVPPDVIAAIEALP